MALRKWEANPWLSTCGEHISILKLIFLKGNRKYFRYFPENSDWNVKDGGIIFDYRNQNKWSISGTSWNILHKSNFENSNGKMWSLIKKNFAIIVIGISLQVQSNFFKKINYHFSWLISENVSSRLKYLIAVAQLLI